MYRHMNIQVYIHVYIYTHACTSIYLIHPSFAIYPHRSAWRLQVLNLQRQFVALILTLSTGG